MQEKLLFSLEEAEEQLRTPNFTMDHYELPLSEVTLNSPDSVEIAGESLSLSKFGQRSLCKILEVPNNFNTRLHADDTELWSEMVRRLEKLRDKKVRISTQLTEKETTVIDAFNVATEGWLSNEAFLKNVRFWLDYKPVKIALKGILMDTSGGIMAHFNLPENESGLLEDKTDLFTMGFTMSNSEVLRWRTSGNLDINRLVCTNLARITEKSYGFYCRHGVSSQRLAEDFWSNVQNLVSMNISVEAFINSRVSRLLGTQASLRELKACNDLVSKKIDAVEAKIPDFPNRVPYAAVVAKYGDIKGKSERWLSTASTPVNSYKLFNEMTWITSHTELNPEVKQELDIAIGNIFLSDRMPDLLDVAPDVRWN
jgi:hypothetical protein